MDTATVLVVTLVVLLPAAMLWAIYISRTGRARRPQAILRIPQALRPAQPDEVLEGPRLQRIQAWGLVATVATAAFIPLYWLPEQQRQESFVDRFNEESLRRGSLIFAIAPELEEDASAEQFKEQERALSLGQGCANCHGSSANTAEREVIPQDGSPPQPSRTPSPARPWPTERLRSIPSSRVGTRRSSSSRSNAVARAPPCRPGASSSAAP